MVKTMKLRAHIFISGRVQGVFFRSKTAVNARRIGVAGWIKNLPDGRVEAIFEGDKEAVEKLINFCKTGPSRAFVETIDIRLGAYSGDYKGFAIVH